MSNIESLTKYLETKTSYKIEMDVVLDKNLGFLYSVKISLDNDFSVFTKFILYSTGKQNIKTEILQNIAHFDFCQNKKLGGTTKKITRQVKSSSLTINCIVCGEKSVRNFHRNIASPLFKQRGGYSHVCNECAYTRATEILEAKDSRTALVFLCGVYDRPFIRQLSDLVIAMNLSPVEMFGQYFKRLNLVSTVKNGENTFASSDIFEGGG